MLAIEDGIVDLDSCDEAATLVPASTASKVPKADGCNFDGCSAASSSVDRFQKPQLSPQSNAVMADQEVSVPCPPAKQSAPAPVPGAGGDTARKKELRERLGVVRPWDRKLLCRNSSSRAGPFQFNLIAGSGSSMLACAGLPAKRAYQSMLLALDPRSF